MKKLVSSADQLAGLFVGLLGLAVAARWVFQSEAIAVLIPGSARMGIVSPALFMAAGTCCYFARGRWRAGTAPDVAWRLLAALAVVFPALVLSQHLFDIALGIDFVRVPTAPTPNAPHPGRMAPNTCIAFILAGAALHLVRHPRPGRLRMLALSACAALVMGIGIAALLGYFLKLEAMYRLAASNVMLPVTAIGMSMLGAGLWSARNARLAGQRPPASSEKRITWRALGVVTLVALGAGAAGFATLRDSYEDSLSQNMLFAATASANTIANTLGARRRIVAEVIETAGLAAAFRQPAGPARLARLEQTAAALVRAGVNGVRLQGPGGEPLAASGKFVADGVGVHFALALDDPRTTLVWERGYVLRTVHEVRDGAGLAGRVVVERRLALLDGVLDTIHGAGGAEILVCQRRALASVCAPTRAGGTPLSVPLSAMGAGINLALAEALQGKAGVMSGRDLRGAPVLLAYTPVRGLGLGLVARNNIEALYAPLRERANMLVLVLVVLVALGASALLFQVRPLLAQLVREQRRTRVILENSSDAFVSIGIDGRITDWNTEAEHTFGWSAAEALGRDMADLIIPPALRAAHNEGFARFAASGEGDVINTRLEVMALRRDGTEIPVELSVAAFHNGRGYVANAFMRDITERRRLSQENAARAAELEQERDRAEAANRAKGEFVANMSHELRTPMNAVLGMTYLLGHTDLKDEQRKYLDMIRESGRSLLGIMNDILDFSKVEAGKMALEEGRFLLCDVLGGVATIMSVNAGDKDLELAIGVDPEVPQVLFGDAMRLQQVLVNLAGNAIKFTESGEVSVLVELLARDGAHATLQVRVRDTGIGMDAAQQERVFSPFIQGDASTTRRFGGTGLGLAISRNLVGLMKGAIAVDSALGRGSEFRVTVPLRVMAEHDDTRAAMPAMEGLRILVVDDNATSRDYIARTVACWGWHAECAASGEEALEKVRQAGGGSVRRGGPRAGAGFDVVLADWQMPGMDGMKTMEAVRNVSGRGRLPIALMVNAYGRGKLMQAPAASRADAIISKPVTGSSLFDTLHQILVERVRGAGRQGSQAPAAALERLDGARLLMAEDNQLNQAVARGILEQAGARVDIVGNGELAVQRLAAAPAAYDLVLMDIQMPVTDGYTATRQIRGTLGLTLPILAITAGVTEPERASYIAAGMDDLIAKPLEVDQMVAAIARYLNRRQRFGPLPPHVPAAAPRQDDLPVLGIGPLVALANGDRFRLGGVAKLLQRVIADSAGEFEQARASWKAGDAAQASRMLHGLRGGVGSIGAKRFAHASLALEQAIKAGAEGKVEGLFEQAGAELDAALAAAAAWIDANAVKA